MRKQLFYIICFCFCLCGFSFGNGDRASHLYNPITYQTIPTYVGVSELAHPDVRYFEGGWNGYTYWMAMTPFRGDDDEENPSIVACNDGESWEVPGGLTNPIDPDPKDAGGNPNQPHNCDTDLFYNLSSDELWCYWIECGDGTTNLMRKKSSDGSTWGAQEIVLTGADYFIVSPAFEKVGDVYMMWYVNPGALGSISQTNVIELRTSADGDTWSEPTTCVWDCGNWLAWHLDVIYIPELEEYAMLIAAHLKGSYGDNELMFSTSSDGVNFKTYKNKLVRNSIGEWDSGLLHRGTMLYLNGLLKIWYSGMSGANVWHCGYVEKDYELLKNDLDAFCVSFNGGVSIGL